MSVRMSVRICRVPWLLDEVHVYDPGVRLYDPDLQEDGSGFKDPAVMARAFAPGGSQDIFVAGTSDALCNSFIHFRLVRLREGGVFTRCIV